MKEIKDMTEIEFREFFFSLSRDIEDRMPLGHSKSGKCLYFLLIADTKEPESGVYVTNMEFSSLVNLIRKTADNIEQSK